MVLLQQCLFFDDNHFFEFIKWYFSIFLQPEKRREINREKMKMWIIPWELLNIWTVLSAEEEVFMSSRCGNRSFMAEHWTLSFRNTSQLEITRFCTDPLFSNHKFFVYFCLVRDPQRESTLDSWKIRPQLQLDSLYSLHNHGNSQDGGKGLK